MFDKIKAFFKKEEEPPEELTLLKGAEMVDSEYSSEHKRVENLILEQTEELENTRKTIEDRLVDLEKAELRNAKITTREIQFMKGNRENYLRLSRYFIARLGKPPKTEKDLVEFQKSFTDNLSTLKKSTRRNFMVLQDFFKNEVGAIAYVISSMEKQIHSLATMHKTSKLGELKQLKEHMGDLQRRMAYAKEAEKELESARKDVAGAKKSVADGEADLESHSKSDGMKELDKIESSRDSKEEEINRLRNGLREHFSVLDRALRKYEHISMDPATLKSLLKNPVLFSLVHPEKTVSSVLQPLRKSIDSLDLKDKKKIKTLRSLEYLDKSLLESLKEKHDVISKELEDIKVRIRSHPSLLEYKDKKDKVEYARTAHERAKQKLDSIEAPITDNQINSEISNLQKSISEHFDREIILKR